MHYFSLRGSFLDKAGDDLLGLHMEGLDDIPGLYDYFAIFEKLFNEHKNGLFGKEQFAFVKILGHLILVRFQDRFTKTEEAKNRFYKRLEIHVFSENEFSTWTHIYEFINVNPLKQVNNEEKITFNLFQPDFVNRAIFSFEVLKDIVSCILLNMPYYTSVSSFSLANLIQLMDSSPAFGELAFMGFDVNKYNFSGGSNTNIYVANESEAVDNSVPAGLLINEYVQTVAARASEIKIPEGLKEQKEYYKRLNWLLQYEYCKTAFSDSNLDNYKTEQLSFLFNLSNKIIVEVPFLIDNEFKEGLVRKTHLYYEDNKELVNKVRTYCLPQMKYLPTKEIKKILINTNSIRKAFDDYKSLFVKDEEAFSQAVAEIVKNNFEIEGEYKDKTIDILLLDKENYKLLEKLLPWSVEQKKRIFENIHETEFPDLESNFDGIQGIENLSLDFKKNESNKINFIRNKILTAPKIPFSTLFELNKKSHIENIRDLVFEVDMNTVEFKKGDKKNYKKLFMQNDKEKELLVKIKSYGAKSFFEKWKVNRQQIKSIKAEHEVIAKLFRTHYLTIAVLGFLLFIGFWVGYFYIGNLKNVKNQQENQIKILKDSIQAIKAKIKDSQNEINSNSINDKSYLSPQPNRELNERDLRNINKKILKDKSVIDIVDIIFQGNPSDIRSHYNEQKNIYIEELIKRNFKCFDIQRNCICDSLLHIPSFKN